MGCQSVLKLSQQSSASVKYTEAVVVLVGDLNTTLSEEDTVTQTSLTSIVNKPTRGSSKLDRIYLPKQSYHSVHIAASAAQSDHKAVEAYVDEQSFQATSLGSRLRWQNQMTRKPTSINCTVCFWGYCNDSIRHEQSL